MGRDRKTVIVADGFVDSDVTEEHTLILVKNTRLKWISLSPSGASPSTYAMVSINERVKQSQGFGALLEGYIWNITGVGQKTLTRSLDLPIEVDMDVNIRYYNRSGAAVKVTAHVIWDDFLEPLHVASIPSPKTNGVRFI